MGIPGLTTFIKNRSDIFMENYHLHDSNLVIDGNSLSCQLYLEHCQAVGKLNDCFGGDYDKYAYIVRNFFRVLSKCNVTPYIVCDGGYENRKMPTILNRMKNNIRFAEKLNSTTDGRGQTLFPLCLRETFMDIVLNLKIKAVRCDFEADTDTATIARTLNCPVLTYDSDFFIFDVMYIPFPSFKIEVQQGENKTSKETYNYIFCEIYKVEKFLTYFGGLTKTNLPLLAVLLGNDYVNSDLFSVFFYQMKIRKLNNFQEDLENKIRLLIKWLQNETAKSAKAKILMHYDRGSRIQIAETIEEAIKGYDYSCSDYLKYLDVIPQDSCSGQSIQIDSGDEECSAAKKLKLIPSEKVHPNIPIIFFENYRKCLYPASFMDIVVQNKYYCIPQIDDNFRKPAHTISFEILAAIHKILTNSTHNLICIARNKTGQVEEYIVPLYNHEVPSLCKVQTMDLQLRKHVLLKVLKINESFVTNCLNLFPEPCQLLIITIKYLLENSTNVWPLIYSLIVCRIVLKYVHNQVGFCRSTKSFQEQFGAQLVKMLNNSEKSVAHVETIKEALEGITYNDSLICLQLMLPYFEMNSQLRSNCRLFNRSFVHSMAQFQSCFLHVKNLNMLLNYPYPHSSMADFYNGTFIYNLMTELSNHRNLDDNLENVLQKTQTVLNSVKRIVRKIREQLFR